MKITFRRCSICSNFHNHVSCQYCGAFTISGKAYNVGNGRMMARGLPLPRVLESQMVNTITRISHGSITSRISH